MRACVVASFHAMCNGNDSLRHARETGVLEDTKNHSQWEV